MPDQNIQTVQDLDALPIGSVVRDRESDKYTRVTDDPNQYSKQWRRSGYRHAIWSATEIADQYGPATLVSRPDDPDLYQQARIALRDRYGVEPDEDDIQRVCQAIDEEHLTPSAAVSALSLAKAYEEQKAPAAHEQTYQLTHDITVTITTGDVVASVTLEAGAYPGTARRTLHSITDRLADQIGALR